MQQRRKGPSIWVTVFFLVVPLLVMLWNVETGVILLVIGSIVTMRYRRAWRTLHRGDRAGNPDRQDKRDRSQTVLVELFDEHGNELPAEEAERRLAVARAEAGPRDIVIPLRECRNG
ncbi:MAG: hypothetical protein H0X37_09090 [Herpetosiphonaceae bacterium]|nr:hypothetical protein [Herpetosiphonaceae bacterium]